MTIEGVAMSVGMATRILGPQVQLHDVDSDADTDTRSDSNFNMDTHSDSDRNTNPHRWG